MSPAQRGNNIVLLGSAFGLGSRRRGVGPTAPLLALHPLETLDQRRAGEEPDSRDQILEKSSTMSVTMPTSHMPVRMCSWKRAIPSTTATAGSTSAVPNHSRTAMRLPCQGTDTAISTR